MSDSEDDIQFIVLRFYNYSGIQQWVVPRVNIEEYLFSNTPSYLVLPIQTKNKGIEHVTFQLQRVKYVLPDNKIKLGPSARLSSVDSRRQYEVYETTRSFTVREENTLASLVSVEKKLARRVLKVEEISDTSLYRL